MPAYLTKSKDEILRKMVKRVERDTPVTSTAPGSVLRALIEVSSTELADFYDLLDFNVSQQFISTATGSALDMLGSLYDVQRKTVSNLTAIDRTLGVFYFYIQSTFGSNIVIPKGTRIYTDISTYIGQQYSYETTEDAIIPTGRLRAFASIKPTFTDSVFTAGVNTLVVHDFASPVGTTVLCRNVKPIQAQIGYEDDDGFRFRIIKKIRVNSGGTEEAVRFAGLAVAGVRDIRIRQAPYGLGSYEVIVVPEDYGNANEVLTKVSTSISSVRPVGVRAFLKRPITKTVDISYSLIIPSSNATGVVETASQRSRASVVRYIASLLPGDTLVYNRLVQIILDSSDLVKDVVVTRFAIAGAEASRRNYQPDADQQLIPGSVIANIARA